MEHKGNNMVNVLSPKCIVCKKERAYYSVDGKTPKYCKTHKLGDMKSNAKRCAYDGKKGCDKHPTFGYEKNKAIFCEKHKKEDMKNVRRDECVKCTKTATYNIKGETRPMFCAKHANQKTMINVVAKTCSYKDCLKQPIFNYINEVGGLYCVTHKLDSMIRVVYVRCKHEDCDRRAYYNYKKYKGVNKYCHRHKKKNMTTFDYKLCKTEICNGHSRNSIYKGYCFECFTIEYPNVEISISYRTKEFAVVDHIKQWLYTRNMVFNKTIQGGYSSRRPDIYIDMGSHIIIVEVDEHGHSIYNKDDDADRTLDIIEDIKNRKLCLIRFNPDKYKRNNNIIVPSPWVKTLTGTKIDPDYKSSWNDRLESLLCCIEYNMENEPDSNFIEIYLFF